MFGLSPFELMVIGVIAVVLFGANLPEVARKFGGSYRELRRTLNDVQQQFRDAELEAKKTLTLDEKKKVDKKVDIAEEFEEPSAPKFKPPV